MDELLLMGGLVALIVIIGVIAFVVRSNRPRHRTRRYQRDETGALIGIGGTQVGEPVTMEGKGTYSGTPSQLKPGYYVISYELDTPTKVALLNQRDGDERTILLSSGIGLKEFEVKAEGNYLWSIAPSGANSPWRIVCRPVKRRSR